jgi:hypothetical protein
MHLDACACAIHLDPQGWWVRLVEEALESNMWKANTSEYRLEKVAWLLSAACFASLIGPGNPGLMSQVTMFIDRHRKKLFWAPMIGAMRALLTESYARVLAREGNAAAERALVLAREIHLAATLQRVLDVLGSAVGASARAEIEDLYARRLQFENRLRITNKDTAVAAYYRWMQRGGMAAPEGALDDWLTAEADLSSREEWACPSGVDFGGLPIRG